MLAFVAAIALAAALGPPALDVAAVCLVFLIGITLGRALPRDLPRPADLVRPWRLVAAGAAVACAGGIVLLPALSPGPQEDARSSPTAAPGASRLPSPRAAIQERRMGRSFVIDRVRFKVFVPGRDAWADRIRREPVRSGMRWAVLGVKATNLARPRFNGNTLAYRLRAGGALIAPRFSGGTGPRSLALTGRLRRGASSMAQLGFEVPRTAGRLLLVFEPEHASATQVQVVLEGEKRLAGTFGGRP